MFTNVTWEMNASLSLHSEAQTRVTEPSNDMSCPWASWLIISPSAITAQRQYTCVLMKVDKAIEGDGKGGVLCVLTWLTDFRKHQ